MATNDDGVFAEGLWALVRELRREGKVVVIAPDREQSGIGTAVTLQHPIKVTPFVPPVEGVEAFSVEGTPADCVILGLNMLAPDAELIVSGINAGANLGYDALISGTVGAALQGFFYKIPAIALSIEYSPGEERIYFESAAKVGSFFVRKFKDGILGGRIILNINLPNLPLHEIRGVEVTRLGLRSYKEAIKPDIRGKRFWILRDEPHGDEERGTDIWAVREGMISITPLHSDLTDLGACSLLKGMELSEILKL